MAYLFFAILPFMVCLFWTAVFVLEWNGTSPAKKVLTVFMAVATLLYFCHAMFFTCDNDWLPLANTVYAFCNLAVYPLYYLYIRQLTTSEEDYTKLRRIFILLFLPSFFVGTWAFINNFLLIDNDFSEETRLVTAKVLFFALVLPVCYYGLKRLNDFDKRLDEYYSNTETRSMKKTRTIMIVLVVCSLCSVTVNHIGRMYFNDNMPMLFIPSLLFGSLLFGIGYVGQKQVFSVIDMEKELAEEEARLTEETDTQETSEVQNLVKEAGIINNRLKEEFEKLMQKKRLFLKNDLKMTDVALELRISRSTLSLFLNQTLGKTFSDYVNELRVNYAKEFLLKESSDPSFRLIFAVDECGFTSESSFYRIFRKYMGVTPNQWLKEMKRKDKIEEK